MEQSCCLEPFENFECGHILKILKFENFECGHIGLAAHLHEIYHLSKGNCIDIYEDKCIKAPSQTISLKHNATKFKVV